MMARQKPPGMMSPPSSSGAMMSSSPVGPPMKRPMAPQGIIGPGMRLRGPVPPQYQQGYGPNPQMAPQPPNAQPMDIKKLGMKLGGAISITSSEASFSGPQPPTTMRRPPMPGTSRMMASSPKNDPLGAGPSSASRPPTLPQRHMSQEQPVEVKQEPMDEFEEGEDDLPEDYEEECEGYGEEEEEDEDEEDQEFGQDLYAGDASYDDDVDQHDPQYQH